MLQLVAEQKFHTWYYTTIDINNSTSHTQVDTVIQYDSDHYIEFA